MLFYSSFLEAVVSLNMISCSSFVMCLDCSDGGWSPGGKLTSELLVVLMDLNSGFF